MIAQTRRSLRDTFSTEAHGAGQSLEWSGAGDAVWVLKLLSPFSSRPSCIVVARQKVGRDCAVEVHQSKLIGSDRLQEFNEIGSLSPCEIKVKLPVVVIDHRPQIRCTPVVKIGRMLPEPS